MDWKITLKLLSVGLLTGLINGLLGIGGGTVLIPAMVFLMGIRQHQAHGTSLAVILPTALVSSIVYGLNKNLDLALAIKVATSGMVGGYIGAKLMNHISARHLRKFFGLFMIIAGLKMVII